MNRTIEDTRDVLSPAAMERLLHLLIAGERHRVSSTVLDGRTVWIKRYDVERTPAYKCLHEKLSRLMPAAFLRASPCVDGKGAIEREMRKLAAFEAAGLPTAQIFFGNDKVLVLSDVSPIAQGLLNKLAARGDFEAHDRLLVNAAQALRKVHERGLCHGRPHPRDMFIREDGEWGFVDFEEEPEAAMPLAVAQARDVWLLFLQVCSQARLESTADRAFDSYFASSPHRVGAELRRIVGFLAVLMPLLSAIEYRGLGSDGRRVLKAMRFLKTAVERTIEAPAENRRQDMNAERGYEG